MPDQHLSDPDSPQATAAPSRRLPAALVAGSAAVLTAGIVGLAVWAGSPTGSTASDGEGDGAAASETVATLAAPVSASPVPSASAEPVAEAEPAADESVDPVYDASTDLSTIPRPPADWSEEQRRNAEIWLEQAGIIADCMLEQGFDYTFTPYWMLTPGPIDTAAPAFDAEWYALWGRNEGSGDDYDWRDAGCHGYAVHVTGMYDAN
ncbi:hypothetical protein [Agromyces arachidis]|uniref:hypothetical protein n=1 Tax=Agromyces arachidis TaxID=766966 RepID=UPI00405626F1